MKKSIIIGVVVLSTLAFAKGAYNNNFSGRGQGGQGQGTPMRETQASTLTDAQQKELITLREAHQKVADPLILSIQEKDLAIQKELLADKVNWTKIEGITKEKEAIETKLEIQRLKNQAEIEGKFGINVGGFGNGSKGYGKGFRN